MLLVLGIVAIVVGPFVVGPVLVKSVVWFGSRPTITRVHDPRPEVQAVVAANEPALLADGFEPEVTIEIRDMSPNQVLFGAMYRHPKGHAAMIATVFVNGVAHASHVELTTQHADRWVCTSNTKQAPFGPRTDDVVVVRATWMDAAGLCALHRTACRTHGRSSIVPITSGETAIHQTIARYVARLREHGYVVPERDGRYRLTWKGALLGTFVNLPPGSWLERRRAERRARAIAGERPAA